MTDSPGEGPIDIVLADDHAVVRSALRALLDAEPDLRVVAEAADAEGGVAAAAEHGAGILLLDLNMPGKPSLEAIAELGASSSGPRVVVLTMESQSAMAREALEAGAHGYVLKQAAERELVEAVRTAAAGGTYVQRDVESRLDEGPPARAGDLTEREVEVLGLIALGHTSGEIAERLGLSVRTVESHRAHIQQKLRVDSRPQLVRYALDRGLLPLDE